MYFIIYCVIVFIFLGTFLQILWSFSFLFLISEVIRINPSSSAINFEHRPVCTVAKILKNKLCCANSDRLNLRMRNSFLSITRFCPFVKHSWIYNPPTSSVRLYHFTPSFLLYLSINFWYTTALNAARYFIFLLSILFRRFRSIVPPQYFSSSFRVHPDFISLARWSLLARVLSFSISFAPLFSRRHIFRRSFLISLRLLQRLRAVATRARSHAILLRVVDSLPAAPFISLAPHALLTVRRTLESHKALRRIFHAAISASRDERRYSSQRPIRPEKNGGDLVWTRSNEISLASCQTSWCRARTEKRRRSAIKLHRSRRRAGKRREKQRFS